MDSSRPNSRPHFTGPRPPRQPPRERKLPPKPTTGRLHNDDGTAGQRVAVLHPVHAQALLTLVAQLDRATIDNRPLILTQASQEAIATITAIRTVAANRPPTTTPPPTSIAVSLAPPPASPVSTSPLSALPASPTHTTIIPGTITPLARIIMAATADVAGGYASQQHKYDPATLAMRALEEAAILVQIAARVNIDVRLTKTEMAAIGSGLGLSWQCVHTIIHRLTDRGLLETITTGPRDQPTLLTRINFGTLKSGYRKDTKRRVAQVLPSTGPGKDQRAENREQRTENVPTSGAATSSPVAASHVGASPLSALPPCPHHGGLTTPAHQCPTCARLRQLALARKGHQAAAHQMDLFGDSAA